MKRIFNIIRGNQIYAQATVLFIANSFSNLFNLLYHLFMVRALTPEEYGILNTLFACILFFALPTGNLQIAMTKFIAHYHGLESKFAINKVLKGMFFRILIIGGIVSFFIFLSAQEIGSYFKISNLTPVYSMGGVVIASLLMPIPLAGLQGLQKFYPLGLTMIFTNFGKLLLAILFVWLGLGVAGALNSLTISSFLCVLVSFPLLRSYLRKITFLHSRRIKVDFGEIYRYILPVSLATLSFVLLTNLDLIFVKHYFTPTEAGYYSIAQMVGKVVLFLPSAICMVMFPKVANSHARKEETIHYLKHSSFYILGLVITAGVVIFISPAIILKIFTAKIYPQCYPLVRRFAVSMGIFAICFNFLLYYLSLNRAKLMIPFLVLLLIEGGLIYIWHQSLIQILNIVIAISLLLLVVNLFILKKKFLKNLF